AELSSPCCGGGSRAELFQSRIEVLGEEAVHEKALGQIPRTYRIQRVLVVDVLRQGRVADDPADADRERMIEVEAVDRIPVLIGGEEETEQAHEQSMRGFEVEPLCRAPGCGLSRQSERAPVRPVELVRWLRP